MTRRASFLYFDLMDSCHSQIRPPAATQATAQLWTQPTPPLPARLSYRSSVEITRTLWWQTRFTRGRVREWKSGHNCVTFQNRTHFYMNFFDKRDLGNHLLQLCPNVNKNFMQELIAYFPLIRRMPHRNRPLKQFLFAAATYLTSHCLATIRWFTDRPTETPHTKRRVKQLFYYCLCIRFSDNVLRRD
jgi:hypothetical protein